ncbi:MAG TPA: NrsF family protein [Polyangiaceae bacterium]|jgi:hypothetical protein|nr:NrsF family protein [Polyangiaceae bacterium]
MRPPPELKLRVLARVRQLPSPARREANLRRRAFMAAGLLVPLLGFLLLGGSRPGQRPRSLVIETALGALVLAVSSLWIVLGGGRMLGRSRTALLSVVAFWPVSLLLWKLWCGSSAHVPEALLAWPSRPGVLCFGLTFLLGSWPLFALALSRRRSDPTHPLSLGAALGVAAGSYAALLVDLWCPVGYPWHVLLGHVLPILLIGVVGLAVGHFALALRSAD